MRIIAYTYEADVHCIACAVKRQEAGGFKIDNSCRLATNKDHRGIYHGATDNEGNPVHPIFSTDEQLEPLSCGTCHALITEPTRSRQPVTLLVGEL